MKRGNKLAHHWYWIAVLSVPAWLARFSFYRRYVYMGFDQARDSFIFNEMGKGNFPSYGPFALSGGYYMPNYYYRFYGALNILDKSDPVYQALPFVVLSAAGVTLLFWLVWLLTAQVTPKPSTQLRILLLFSPLILVGFSYNELINMPLMWNPVNLVFWQVVLFLMYVRIQHREQQWQRLEGFATWFGFAVLSVLAASMHGTFLYAVPIWTFGLLIVRLLQRRWIALSFIGGAAFALYPFFKIESRNQFENIKIMLGMGGNETGQIQNGLDFDILQNLWNNLGQFAHKVLFGLDEPSVFWTVVLGVIMAIGLSLMICKYRFMRWYVWWVFIYIVMAGLFQGERGDTIISWHYQQNIMLLPVFAVVFMLLYAHSKKPALKNKSTATIFAQSVRLGTVLVVAVFMYGVGQGMWRMLGRQYDAVYKPNHMLMTTYQMEQTIKLLPEASKICVPYGYYHPATYEYLSSIRLERVGDVFMDMCDSSAQYIWVLKYYYTFWPPHYAVKTLPEDVERYSSEAQKIYETDQYVMYKLVQ